jgi:TldD protein
MTDVNDLLLSALNEAMDRKIDFLESRWGCYHKQFLNARDQVIEAMVDETSEGMNVRVFHKGAWGFAAGVVKTKKEVADLVGRALNVAKAGAGITAEPIILTPLKAHETQWRSAFDIDPFAVPLQEKIDLLLALNTAMAGVEHISEARSHMYFHRMDKKYVNTLGSRIDQTIIHSDADFTATAVGNDRCEIRSCQSLKQAIGYEGIRPEEMLSAAPRIAREAVELTAAKPWNADTADLILLPSHTRLVIHETIGHATELDRIIGWEADYAGTSFATPDKLKRYRYGSDAFNVTADRTLTHGLATCACDDEGVPAEQWKIVDRGVLTGYATTRDTAPLIGQRKSHGCAYADHWSSIPILRMPNVGIDSGPKGAPTLSQLIEDTPNGILVDGMAAFSIDHQRLNFQFSGEYCRRIRNGKVAEPLWNVVYDGANPTFWSSLDQVCCAEEWRPYGLFGCAKGQPVQSAALTHGSAPLRLKNVSIRRTAK